MLYLVCALVLLIPGPIARCKGDRELSVIKCLHNAMRMNSLSLPPLDLAQLKSNIGIMIILCCVYINTSHLTITRLYKIIIQSIYRKVKLNYPINIKIQCPNNSMY